MFSLLERLKLQLLGQKLLSFDWGPLPPLSTWVGLPPSFLHTASNQKLDGERPGNEAIRLQFMSS